MSRQQLSEDAAVAVSYTSDSQIEYIYWKEGKGRIDAGTSKTAEKVRFGFGFKVCKGYLMRAFLPQGYPDSVPEDYLCFQAWDAIQGICSYVRGMLCSHALLVGVGVGKDAATPMGALLHFLVRDLSGMMGGIVFASMQGSNLDAFAKQWRFFADCMNNISLAIDLAAPNFPNLFLPMLCIGRITGALVGVAGNASRSSLTYHFAKDNNAGDIAAKEGTQETAATLVGMLLGYMVTRTTAESLTWQWSVFALLTVVHMYANMKAITSIALKSLNSTRIELLFKHFMKKKTIRSPKDIAKIETILPLMQRRIRIRIGDLNNKEHYVIKILKKNHILVTCKRSDLLKAYVHALCVLEKPEGNALAAHKLGTKLMKKHFVPFAQKLKESEWDLNVINIV